MILILSSLHQFTLTFYCFNKNMNTNIDISDVEDFASKSWIWTGLYSIKKLFILPKYLFNNQNLLLEITWNWTIRGRRRWRSSWNCMFYVSFSCKKYYPFKCTYRVPVNFTRRCCHYISCCRLDRFKSCMEKCNKNFEFQLTKNNICNQ